MPARGVGHACHWRPPRPSLVVLPNKLHRPTPIRFSLHGQAGTTPSAVAGPEISKYDGWAARKAAPGHGSAPTLSALRHETWSAALSLAAG